MVPWAGLIALLYLKPNRIRGTRAILLPYMLVWGVLSLVQLTTTLSSVTIELPPEVPSLSLPGPIALLWLGLGALWLLSYRLAGLSRAQAFFAALGIMFVAGVVGLLFGMAFDMSLKALVLYVQNGCLYAAEAFVTLGTLIVAGYFCRKRYSPLRFCVGVLLCPLVIGCVAGVVLAVPSLAAMGVAGAGVVLLSCILVLPFLLLPCFNRVCRERFLAIFGFAPPALPAPASPPG